ncbi:MAG TPA: hypothetical protein K8W23_07770, partial [Sellimonas intestinalis]|nr:hypothetical protein [Sellimonas intestinalis]
VYYKLASQVELECTEEQIAVLEELNNLDLYKPVTNIKIQCLKVKLWKTVKRKLRQRMGL